MNFVLLWMLVGTLATNLLWIKNHKKVLNDFDLWKEVKNKKLNNVHYFKGIIGGLFFGPFALLFLFKK